ncbi:MAG: hypothetical protein M3467_01950 [Actinomycetota bacterium]|nr:hypothetical protein [Actinomycetota bacterium]
MRRIPCLASRDEIVRLATRRLALVDVYRRAAELLAAASPSTVPAGTPSMRHASGAGIRSTEAILG